MSKKHKPAPTTLSDKKCGRCGGPVPNGQSNCDPCAVKLMREIIAIHGDREGPVNQAIFEHQRQEKAKANEQS